MTKFKRLAQGLGLLVLVSCGNPFKKDNAPVIKGQTGLLANCTTESQALEIAKKHNGQYRVISEKNKVMEIIGIDKKTLEKELPRARMVQNKIYDNLIASSAKTLGEQVQIQSATRNSSHEFNFYHLKQIDGFYVDQAHQGQGVTIAIVDSGVYYNHEHLLPNLKINSSEAFNSSDNDGNGLVDDVRGWDFYNGDNDPTDDNGHGTHVAGLAAGTLSGVAQKAKILPIKVLSSNGSGDLGTVAAGILYAIEQGSQVVNLSLGGSSGGELTDDVRQLLYSVGVAENNNVMLVAAAGNGGDDFVGDENSGCKTLPADVVSQAVISVAAVDSANDLAIYSNFGKTSVDIAAPGGSGSFFGGLLSTYLPNCHSNCNELTNYAKMSGTSMAAPVVSGLIAIIKSLNPSLNHAQLKELLFRNGESHSQLEDKLITGKVINVENTINDLI